MLDENSINEVLRLKQKLTNSDFDAEISIETFNTNRGNKLKRSASGVHFGKLWTPNSDNLEVIEYGDKRQKILQRRPDCYDNESDSEIDEEAEESPDEYSFSGIKLEKLLAPIGHPSELANHPGISKAYTNNAITLLQKRAMNIIVNEQKHLIQINKLLAAFLGDSRAHALPPEMKYPPPTDVFDGEPRTAILAPDHSIIKDANGEKLACTAKFRTLASKKNDDDLFFALPKYEPDRDLGFANDISEEVRQLCQMASQRSSEFVRNMTRIRMGLLKADRYRNKIYKWSREIGGELSEEDGEHEK